MQLLAPFALLAASLTSVLAQGNASEFGTGLVQALRANNLTTLANAAGNNTAALLPFLQGGNKTVFAPSDTAFQQAGFSNNVDAQTLLRVLSYHIVNSTITQDTLPGDVNETAIVLSSLRGEPAVQLPNNRSQAIVLVGSQGDDDNNASVRQYTGDIAFSLQGAPTFQNVKVVPIQQVLTPPVSFDQAAEELNLRQINQLLQQNQLASALNSTDALTLFAPNDEAIQRVQDQFGAATDEQKRAVLTNHVINGTVVYSTRLEGDNAVRNATSASGQNLNFEEEDGTYYVVSNGTRARIVRSDNLVSNGVVHIIDTVLLNTENNPQAAASAASSASAQAATATAVEGASGNGGSGSNTGSGGSGSGGNGAAGVVAGLTSVGAASVFAAGVFLLA